jgi:hypothetical protein
LNGCQVGGEDDDALGEVEVVLGEADRQDQCTKICVKCSGGDAEVHVVWAIPVALGEGYCCAGGGLLPCCGWLSSVIVENTFFYFFYFFLTFFTFLQKSKKSKVF